MSKEYDSKQDLGDYIQKSAFEDRLAIDQGGDILLHWADWMTTCQAMKLSIETGECDRKELLDLQINQLKEEKVLIATKQDTKEFSLYDVYCAYLDPCLRDLWFLNPQSEILISFGDVAGPYMRLDSLRWMDRQMTQNFAHQKILEGRSNIRHFRLRTHLMANVKGGELFEKEFELGVDQITPTGILFRIQGRENLNRLILSPSLEIELPLKPLCDLAQRSEYKFKNGLDALNIKNMDNDEQYEIYRVNLRSSLTKHTIGLFRISDLDDHFLFIGFENFLPLNSRIDLGESMRTFLAQGQNKLKEESIFFKKEKAA